MSPNAQNTDIAVTVLPFRVQANPTEVATVARRSPLPLPLPDPQPQQSLTTETLYRAPPTTVPSAPQPNDGGGGVPIGAIAGGAVAGALLAILVVVGWVWWGRSIKKDAEIQRLETATRRNTMQNAGTVSRIGKPKARASQLHGRPIEKAVSFAPSTPTSTDEANTPIANAHPRTFEFDEKTGLKPITNGRVVGLNGHGEKANGVTNHARTNGNGDPSPPTNLSAPRAQPPPPPPVSQTRGKRATYSRRSLKNSPPRGILAMPGQRRENGNGQGNGQGHQRQASAAPLLAEHYMDENRGRRNGDPEEGLGEHEHQVRRTPSGMLWAALGLGSSERNSARNSRNSLRTRDSRWSWTSSLDLKLFGQRTHRENNGNGSGRNAKTTMVASSAEEDRASGSVVMGVAM